MADANILLASPPPVGLALSRSLGFVVASVSCAFAVSSDMLIACRMAQGFAAALLIPQGLGILRSVFAPSELGSAFGVFGPVIGHVMPVECSTHWPHVRQPKTGFLMTSSRRARGFTQVRGSPTGASR